MERVQDRKNIVEEIKKAAALYKKHLVGKRFLYVFEGQYIEVIYKAQNFRHLTGVNTRLSAKQFYSYAVRNLLEVHQIGFNRVHPYDLCVKKSNILKMWQHWQVRKVLCWRKLPLQRGRINSELPI